MGREEAGLEFCYSRAVRTQPQPRGGDGSSQCRPGALLSLRLNDRDAASGKTHRTGLPQPASTWEVGGREGTKRSVLS